MSSSRANLEKYLIPLDEIIRATENFNRERYIGGGGFGAVYRGQLSERWQNHIVAVKRLDANSYQGECEFRNEIELISIFHHENIISFIGYCDEGTEMIIVYEYALNGSLDDHLQDPNKMIHMTWAQRLKICIGAAKGLYHLHSGLGEQNRVIHRDVKSANILLDGNMVAKICDFGLSKLGTVNQPDTQLYTKIAGTQFYLDPTYHESRILRIESDVYSFGVVLFEIVSGMLVYRERSIGDERRSLMNTVRRYHQMEPNKVIDQYIRDGMKSRSFDRFKEIAYQCISLNLAERPTLDTVIKKLEEALIYQISCDSATTPADPSVIKTIIGKLNSVSPYDHWIASDEICLLSCNYQNRVPFVKAGVIPLLAHLLTALDPQTQEYALTAFSNLLREYGDKGIILSSGAVPGLVYALKIGSNIAREIAAAIIGNTGWIDGAEAAMGSAGAIPPLVLLLSEGTTTGKKKAVWSLFNLCKYRDNIGRAVTAGLVPILMELLKKPGVLRGELINLLSRFSWHPEGRLAIGEAKAVPHMVEVLGSGYRYDNDVAVTVLVNLCSMDEKYLVEAQEFGVMEKIKGVRQHGTDWGKRRAKELRRMVKDQQHVDHGSDTEPDPTDSWLIAKAKRGARKFSKIFR